MTGDMEKILKFCDKNIEKYFDSRGLDRMNDVAGIPYVVPPLAVLPDFHFKKSMEAPSSIAVAVEGHIIPHLSSCSLNCGMGIITTGLPSEDMSSEAVGAIFDHLRRNRKDPKYDLTRDQLNSVLYRGPKALQDKYDIPDAAIAAFENNGSMVDQGLYTVGDVAKFIPDDLSDRKEYSAISDLGVGFGGNHFLEIQKISEICNKAACEKASIKGSGQVVIMYHGGGGIVPGFIGGYFARRTKGYGNGLKLIYNKIKYHLPSAGSLAGAIDMYKYYFSRKRFVAVPEDSREGRRLILANNIAMNYGYAYRLIMFLRIADALSAVTGRDIKAISLIKDISHNSIQKGEINGRQAWIHRHNACRVTPGAMTILPGYNTTSSYVCEGADNAKASLYSVPHGAGDSIEKYIDAGISKKLNGKYTMVYRGELREPEKAVQYSDEGVDSVIRLLEQERILRPLVKLTPIATLKDYS
jgi:RNA-splicing ligase RtcB